MGDIRNQVPSENVSSMELRGNKVLYLRKGEISGKGVGRDMAEQMEDKIG